MRKSELKQIPIPDTPNFKKRPSETNYVVIAKIVKTTHEKVLVVNFYEANYGLYAFRIFASKTDFITEYADGKWSTATLDNIFPIWNWKDKLYRIKEFIQIDETIKGDFLKQKESNIVLALDKFQKKVRGISLVKKNKNKKERINALMAQVKDLPYDLDTWIKNVPLLSSRYIYYKKDKKINNGYCTHCGKDILVTDKKCMHNGSGVCPSCKSRITYKATGKSTRVQDNCHFAIMQKVDNGIMLRRFRLCKTYCDHYRSPEIRYREDARLVLGNNGWNTKVYEERRIYDWYNQKYNKPEWYERKNLSSYYNYYTYTRNINNVLKNTKYQYSQLATLAKNSGAFDAFEYLEGYIRHPCFEYFIKLGLYRLVHDNVPHSSSYLNLYGKNIKEILLIDKQHLPLLQKCNVSARELDFVRSIINKGGKVTVNNIKNIQLCGHIHKLEDVTKLTTLHRVFKYLNKKNKFYKYKHKISDLLIFWADYLDNAKKLNYNLQSNSVIYPKDIIKAHNDTVNLIEIIDNAESDKIIYDQYENLNELYGFSNDKFLIRPPISAREIKHEGTKLKHCVFTNYLDKVLKSQTIILFIREIEKENEPYYTLEYKNKSIVQCQGLSHKSPTKEVNSFLEQWKKKLNKNIKEKVVV